MRLIHLFFWLALVLPPTVRAQTAEEAEEDEAVGNSVNYVFATDLGSGVYDMNGRSLQIYRYTYRKELREVREDQMGFRFVAPITAGFFDFDPVDVINSGPPTRVDSLSIVPGVEADFIMRDDWHVIPYVRGGFSLASSGVDGWLHGAGLRLERTFKLARWDAFARTELSYAGVNYRDHSVPNDEFARMRQAFSMYHGSRLKARGHELEFGLYGICDVIFDPPTAPVANIEPQTMQLEAGVLFGTRPAIKLWKFELPRLGLGYRSAGDLSGWRIVIGQAF